VQRLSESKTYKGRSLWEAVLEYVQAKTTVLRADVLGRFHNDDGAVLRSVLKDLVDSGMLFQSGRGDSMAYRAASADELALGGDNDRREAIVSMVWVAVNRLAPATRADLQQAVPLDDRDLDDALGVLTGDGRVELEPGDDEPRYTCPSCVIPLGAGVGWEAAVFDHYQAMVTALTTKVRMRKTSSGVNDWVGGSTFGFDVWAGHPERDEVLGLLKRFREQALALRARVEDYNSAHPAPEPGAQRVIAYVGQTVLGLEEEGSES
jgi:hypothetical protein